MANGFGAGVGGAITGGILGFGTELFKGLQQKRLQTRFRRRQRAAIESARGFAAEASQRLTSSPLFTQAQDFLESTFGDPANSPLVQQFRKSLQQAQATRGTFSGGAAEVAEAGGLAVAAQNLRQQLLPQSLQFALAPEQLRQSVLAQEAPLSVAAATGAPLIGQPDFIDPFGRALDSAIQGGAGGFQLGQEFASQSSFNQNTNVDGTPSASSFLPRRPSQGVNDVLQAGAPDSLAELLQLQAIG